MKGAFGYSGGVSVSPRVQANPLAQTPPNQILLPYAAVQQVLANWGLPAWDQLNPAQQKKVAARVLYLQGDQVSQAQAAQVLLSNPAYQVFTIIYGAAAL